MIGAIIGDIVGSVHERVHLKRMDFPLFVQNSRFTDDTVMTLAVAEAIMNQEPFAPVLHRWGRKYPDRGYGKMFRKWLKSDDLKAYNSYGNGSAMRVTPIGYAYERPDQVMQEAKTSAKATHDHPEGIKGAQAVALCVLLARKGQTKESIRDSIEGLFGYDLSRTIQEIRPKYKFDATCQGSVPESIIAFLDSKDVEHAIRLGISLGGDADTIACIAGGIAQAFYKEVPKDLSDKARELLSEEALEVLDKFCKKYDVPGHRTA